MESANIENTRYEISADDYLLTTSASKIKFDGFLKVYNDVEDEDLANNDIPDLKQGDEVSLKKVNPKQHFTQPPPRYTEASLVKELEEHGIGRPSTYAPIISKIQTKGYVEKIDKALAPTLLGATLCKQLVEHFQNIMDYEFTAQMEAKLDDIAENKAVWNEVIKDFYFPFIEIVNSASSTMEKVNIESDKVCPNCGKPMLLRTSRFGSQFLGCSGYPDCKTIIPLDKHGQELPEPEMTDEKCEKCGGSMIKKVGPYGTYLECEKCKNRKSIQKSTGVKCPKCSGEIIVRKSKKGKVFYGCNQYPKCDFVLWYEPVDEKCPTCGSLLVKHFTKKAKKLECSNKDCTFSKEVEE